MTMERDDILELERYLCDLEAQFLRHIGAGDGYVVYASALGHVRAYLARQATAAGFNLWEVLGARDAAIVTDAEKATMPTIPDTGRRDG